MFKQCISIGCTVRTHFYVHIPTVFQHLPAHTSTMFKQFLGAILLIPSTFPCAHPCCTPALLACIPTMFKHFLWTFLLCPAFFSVRIPTVLQHCLRAFLLCSSISYFPLCAFMPYSGTDPRGKLSKSSTLWVHCSCLSCISITVPLHFYYISITFPLNFLHFFSSISFPLHFFSSTSCFQLPS